MVIRFALCSFGCKLVFFFLMQRVERLFRMLMAGLEKDLRAATYHL